MKARRVPHPNLAFVARLGWGFHQNEYWARPAGAKLQSFASLAAVLCELRGYKLFLRTKKAFNREDRKGNAKIAKRGIFALA